ncbi:MAG: hypothetical protein MZV63_20020 [Marinilabiliales bacterium]|nr:hypothetical protein [Marinilabiliales bacterium]
MLDLVNRRQSERRYLDKPVEKEKLDRILRREAVAIGMQRPAVEVRRR